MRDWWKTYQDKLQRLVAPNMDFNRESSTTESIFALRMMQENHFEKRKTLHNIMIFVDLEKAYDRVPRAIIWWALRKKNVGEEYSKVMQDMYDGCTTSVRTLLGSTESFEVNVGLHQGSALDPLLFIHIMDVISQEVGRGPPPCNVFCG